MSRVEKVAEGLLRPINPTVIIVLGVYTVIWGLWIFSPFWSVFAAAPLYSAMASISSEYVWGAVAVISGLFIMRGAMKPSYKNLSLGAFIGCLHWLVVALLYFASDWHSTGGITSLTFAIYSALVWANVRVNKNLFKNNFGGK